MKIEAEVIPYSSVVGSGVMLKSPDGPVVAQLAIIGVLLPKSDDPKGSHREASEALAEMIARVLNGQELEI